jgi:hypothetical protein
MSRLVVWFSLGTIRRVPLTSNEARELYRRFPEQEGQLVLIQGDRVTFGRMVFAAVPRTVLVAWLHALLPRQTRMWDAEEAREGVQ